MKNDTWKPLVTSELKNTVDNLNKGWTAWAGKESGAALTGGDAKKDKEQKEGNKDWNPKLPFQITIETTFDEDWFKKQYKSGLLNAAIRAIKTSAVSHAVQDVKAKGEQYSNAGHKYTYDEMLPAEKRKLDSIKWKMTNSVAKDYIKYLLGWSRKKVALKTKEGKIVPDPSQAELKMDTGLGDKFASDAMGGRGIMGRLKQKLFAGGTDSNKISVAFQLADPNDGWKIVDEKTGETIANGDEGKDGKDTGKGGTGDGKGGGDTGAGKGGAGGSGSGSGAGGNKGSGGGKNGGAGGSSGGAGGNLSGEKDLKALLTLIQRVLRLEKEVGIGPGSQSGDKGNKNNKGGEGNNKDNKNNTKEFGNKNNNADKGEKENAKNGGEKNNNNKNIEQNKDNKNNNGGEEETAGGAEKEEMKQAAESTDPFADILVSDPMDEDRRRLLKEVCESGKSVESLIDSCLSDVV